MSRPQQIVLAFVVTFLLALSGGILWASGTGGVIDGIIAIARQPWGLVTLVDLYAGFLLAGAWICLTERRPALLALWLLLLACLGNWATMLYLLIRLVRSRTLREALGLTASA